MANVGRSPEAPERIATREPGTGVVVNYRSGRLGHDEARGDAIGSDAVASVASGEVAGELLDRGLRDAVADSGVFANCG